MSSTTFCCRRLRALHRAESRRVQAVHAASAHERNATRIPSRGSPAGRRPRRVHTRAFKGLDDEGEDDAPAAAPQAGGWAGRYSRVMLKLSGEALEGDQKFGIDPAVLRKVAREVAAASRQGVQIAIVVGGGNFFRGGDRWPGLERTTADHVGMLATVMNGLSLQSALENEGIQTRLQTAIEMREVAEPYIRRRAIRHLERGRVVIFGAGTGNPFFTTDTAAALRAAEIGAEVYLKATQVDGIYDCDPKRNPAARRYSHISYRKCVMDDIQVLDETAFTLCKNNKIPVLVFDLHRDGNITRAVEGHPSIGTVVDSAPDLPGDIEPRAEATLPYPQALAHSLLQVSEQTREGAACL